MEDQQLGRLLRELPEEKARPGFTARVLARLDEPERQSIAWWPRLAWAGIPTMLLVVGISIGLLNNRPDALSPDRAAEARQILDELRAEQERLEQDFQVLRGSEQEGVVYLGGNEEIDLVVDMSNVPEGNGTVPAAYRPTEIF
jgi:hypothetical protein